MASRDPHTTEYEPLDGMGAGDEFSLEDILAEYGGGRKQAILRDVETVVIPDPEPVSQPEEPELTESPRQEELSVEQPPVPPEPRPVTLEEVVGNTVSAVMEEREQEPLLVKKPRRGLFSRKPMEDTEQLYPAPEEEEPEEDDGDFLDEEEEELARAAEDWRERYQNQRGLVPAAFAMALTPILVQAAERYGIIVPWWSDSLGNQALALLACLVLTSLLCWQVFAEAVRTLRKRRCTGEVLAAAAALLTMLDCGAVFLLKNRTTVAPYAAVSCAALAFASFGLTRKSRAMYDTFHAAAVDDEPPYLVTESELGACKQRGSVPGFYAAAIRDDVTVFWQTALLPVVFMASFVFAGLSSLGQGRGHDFLLNWSVILSAGATFIMPLCWSLPYSVLARHLQKAGCAVAGWMGAEKISRRKTMIVTDTDLFPPGTMQLNGVKVYGEELSKAASYAASVARAAGSGLERLFDGLIRSEGGHYRNVDEFSFYEEGGYSATIRGEAVLLGTAAFMRKMDVRLPSGINLKTGIFLAVDRELAAVFAVKYQPSENVDYALRVMKRSGVTPILAARDPNITPALLKRKFHKGIKVEYPPISNRVALSEIEKDRGMPRALLFREGLLPYAEAVVGSQRMVRAVRRCLMLAMFSSVCGTLLAFYMMFLSAYTLLTPLTLLVFQGLWLLPVWLFTDWTGRS